MAKNIESYYSLEQIMKHKLREKNWYFQPHTPCPHIISHLNAEGEDSDDSFED